MSQVCYNIVEILRSRNVHIRRLAEILNVNQMTISRRIRDLQDDNIVDCTYEGKNLMCFLKDSIEAKEYLFMTEHSKLLNILNTYPRLRKIVDNIKTNKNIKLAILFGSFAKGLSLKNSDIDLYIETKNKKLTKELEMIDTKLNIKIGKFDKESNLAKEIIKNHIIIKGVEYFHDLIY